MTTALSLAIPASVIAAAALIVVIRMVVRTECARPLGRALASAALASLNGSINRLWVEHSPR